MGREVAGTGGCCHHFSPGVNQAGAVRRARRLVLFAATPGCGQCGTLLNPTVDHVMPKCKGGMDYLWNLQNLCYTCNCVKGKGETDYRRKDWTRQVFNDLKSANN